MILIILIYDNNDNATNNNTPNNDTIINDNDNTDNKHMIKIALALLGGSARGQRGPSWGASSPGS